MKRCRSRSWTRLCCVVVLSLTLPPPPLQFAAGQEDSPKAPASPGPMLAQGVTDFDSYRSRVYLASRGLWWTLDAENSRASR